MWDASTPRFDRLTSDTAPTRRRFDGADLMAAVLCRWRTLLAAAVCGAALAYGWSLLATPTFVATTKIFIDPRSIQALDTPASQNQGDNNAQVSFVESQTYVLTSEGVLARVVASMNLADDPSFDGEGSNAPLLRWARALGLAASGAPTPAERARTALIALADRVTVRRPERTFVMDVSVKADTADKAAALADAVAQAYFDEQNASRADMAHRAAAALTGRLDQLRDRVRQAEAQLQSFKADHGLVGTRSQLVSEQQLTEASTQLALAQNRLVLAQARLGHAQPSTAVRSSGDAPEAVTSPTMTLLRGQQAEAKRRLREALEQFGPRHPTVREIRAEVDGLDGSIQAELARIGGSDQIEFRRATSAVAAQKAAVDRLSAQAQRTSGALVQLNQLEREVEINKNLLDTFLSRSKQIVEIGDIDAVDGRVISRAVPPRQRSFPPRGSVVALLGALLGFAVAAALSARRAARGAVQPAPLAPSAEAPGRAYDIAAPRAAASPFGQVSHG